MSAQLLEFLTKTAKKMIHNTLKTSKMIHKTYYNLVLLYVYDYNNHSYRMFLVQNLSSVFAVLAAKR
jgi:hypothetical protein